jgi:hypothetical protein
MSEETYFPFENDQGQSWEFEMKFQDDGAAFHHEPSGWRGVFCDEFILLSSNIERPNGMSTTDFQAFVDQVMRDVVPHWMRWKTAVG